MINLDHHVVDDHRKLYIATLSFGVHGLIWHVVAIYIV